MTPPAVSFGDSTVLSPSTSGGIGTLDTCFSGTINWFDLGDWQVYTATGMFERSTGRYSALFSLAIKKGTEFNELADERGDGDGITTFAEAHLFARYGKDRAGIISMVADSGEVSLGEWRDDDINPTGWVKKFDELWYWVSVVNFAVDFVVFILFAVVTVLVGGPESSPPRGRR